MLGLHSNSLPAQLLLRIGDYLDSDKRRKYATEEDIFDDSALPWKQRRALKRMVGAGYLKDRDARYTLTERGQIELLRHRIMTGDKRWDGKWRVMIFDIPEERRRHRDFLRRKLKWIGFVELQRSIWVIPYDVRDELNELFSLMGMQVRGDIRFMTVEEMIHDDDLREQFGL